MSTDYRVSLAPGAFHTVDKSFDMLDFMRRFFAWSEETFGPGERTKGVVDHIRKELVEIEEAPDDLKEWIDVIQLALDGARRAGHTPEQIVAQLEATLTRNRHRAWPDWRTLDLSKPIEHIRDRLP